jgi:hemin uptake protein HemP
MVDATENGWTGGADGMSQTKEPTEQPRQRSAAPPLVLDARVLFQGRREIWIDQGGERYCLRITRRNKLILRK